MQVHLKQLYKIKLVKLQALNNKQRWFFDSISARLSLRERKQTVFFLSKAKVYFSVSLWCVQFADDFQLSAFFTEAYNLC